MFKSICCIYFARTDSTCIVTVRLHQNVHDMTFSWTIRSIVYTVNLSISVHEIYFAVVYVDNSIFGLSGVSPAEFIVYMEQEVRVGPKVLD